MTAMTADNAAPHTNIATAIPTTSPTQYGRNSHGRRLTNTNDKIMQISFHIRNVLKITSKISTQPLITLSTLTFSVHPRSSIPKAIMVKIDVGQNYFWDADNVQHKPFS